MSMPLLLTLLLHSAGPAVVPEDTLLAVDGVRIHLEVRRGAVPVTIVLEHGGAADLSAWSDVPQRLAERTGATVVAYDRAGLGRSDLGPADLTPAQEIARLRDALARLRVPRSTILVGHSYGALLALDHGAAFLDDVAGVVLVDPMNPRFISATGDFVQSTVPAIENPSADRDRVIARMARTLPSLAERVGRTEPEITAPLVVVTAGLPWWGDPSIDAAWRASHEAMAAERPNRALFVAGGSDHDIPAVRPDVIIAAVIAVLEQ